MSEIKELKRIDMANKDNGINFWFADYPHNNGWCTMKQYIPFRLEQLKSAKSKIKDK